MQVEKEVLDYIHDYIVINDSDYCHLNNDFARRELNRLSNIAHLGLMSKLRRLVRHDKLEHAYGTYWLCKQCVEKKPKLVEDKVPFRLAGLLHGIGHAPFSYDTEYAIAKLYKVHENTKKWINGVFDYCTDFTSDSGVKKAADKMKSHIAYMMLHRWFGAYKIAKSGTDEFNNDIGKQIIRIMLDSDLIRSKLLYELDKLDYILRDILYLAIGRIELNFPLLLEQFDTIKGELLIRPNVCEIIEATSDCLCDQVYLGPEERCLRQLAEKAIVKEVMEGHRAVEELINLNGDEDMEQEMLRFESGGIDLEESVKRIKDGKIKEVISIVGDLSGNSIFDVEMDLAKTNKAGIHKYHENKGIYVQCTPDPYYNYQIPFDFTEEGFLGSIAYDYDYKSPHNVISVLSRSEKWLPANLYGVQQSCRKDALRFLAGYNIEIHSDRYENLVENIVKRHVKVPDDGWKPELFNESWSLQKQAPQIFAIYEDEIKSPTKHFIDFPEHWSNEILKNVLEDCRRTFSTMKKRRNENKGSYDDRKDRLLEYITYLETVVRIAENDFTGWVLPSVWIMKEDGTKFAEIDVVAVYVKKEYHSPVIIELFEVSTNRSPDNKDENRKKLRNVAYKIRANFRRKAEVSGFFNGEKVVPPF